ncbi:MAG: RNA-binding S4 domain-containing protein [Pseudomonadota bacterium]
MEGRETQRLDKWLWHARFFKTRTLASEMVSRGKVRVNGSIVKKPAYAVGEGDTLTIVKAGNVRLVRIIGLAERRGGAPEAQALYEDVAAE